MIAPQFIAIRVPFQLLIESRFLSGHAFLGHLCVILSFRARRSRLGNLPLERRRVDFGR